jgi:hypothetical protein
MVKFVAGCALLAVAATVTACAGSGPNAGGPLSPRPLPPTQECTYPSVTELQALTNSSSEVVETTVMAPSRTPLSGAQYNWTYPLVDTRVLSTDGDATPAAAVTEVGGPDNILLPAGRYVLFLTRVGNAFTVTNGFAGRFPVSTSGIVNRQCVNYDTPNEPRQASGNPMPVSSFESHIPPSAGSDRAGGSPQK